MRSRLTVAAALVVASGVTLAMNWSSLSAAQNGARADVLNCSLTGYKSASGLTAALANGALAVTWDADRNQELRLRFTINGGTPTIQELAVRRKGGTWAALATDATPEFRVVTGKRRLDNAAVNALKESYEVKELPADIYEENKWAAFWDAPLMIPGSPARIAPGLGPRKPEEVTRATATYQAQGCAVRTDGTRLMVTFPGVSLGIFSGELQYTVYKGSNLIQQEVIAKTDLDNVAYKYDTGLKGLAIGPGSRMVWRDNVGNRQDYKFGGARNDDPRKVTTGNRLIIAERGAAGSIATFPPPHNFFWTRETAQNLGYNWYRKDSDTSFSFGIRHSESEGIIEDEHGPGDQYLANFPLYNARPGTLQHMPVFFYASADAAEQTRESVLAFTHGDRFKPLPGYQVMGSHYHVNLGPRLMNANSPDAEIVDLALMKQVGINIITLADRVGRIGPAVGGQRNGSPEEILEVRKMQMEGIRRQSDKDFLILLSHEVQPPPMGGHADYFYSHPVYWVPQRLPGQAFVEERPGYGKVYNIGSTPDLMEMAKRENMIISMPHPRAKSNGGYPDGFKRHADAWAAFKDPRYATLGFRWGMGQDRSERRLSEYRVLPVWDDVLNWLADDPAPPKYLIAISEVQQQHPGDETYSYAPVTYLKLATLPKPDEASSVIKAIMDGDSFVSSGEVLIPSYRVQGTGAARKIVLDLEWTFPMDFVEVVWGDGQKTDRQIISMSDSTAHGQRHFEIPFDATGKKWVRFAAWDVAGNGALSQPVKLAAPARNDSR